MFLFTEILFLYKNIIDELQKMVVYGFHIEFF
jgi:hypothetical protein